MSNKDKLAPIALNGQVIQGDFSFSVDDAPAFAITAIVPPGSNVDASRIREVLNVPAHILITVRERIDTSP